MSGVEGNISSVEGKCRGVLKCVNILISLFIFFYIYFLLFILIYTLYDIVARFPVACDGDVTFPAFLELTEILGCLRASSLLR